MEFKPSRELQNFMLRIAPNEFTLLRTPPGCYHRDGSD